MTEHSKMKPPGRVSRAVSSLSRRLEGHTLALGLAVAAIGLVGAWIAWSSVNGVPLQDRYELKVVVPGGAPIVAEGDAVRIAGRLAGLVTAVEPYGEDTEVAMELRPQYAPVGRDVRARVRVKSIIGLTYVELLPGNIDDPLPEGSTIPVRRTDSGVELLQVVQLFDQKARRTLRRAAFDVGTGLAGRGRQLNAALSDLPEITTDGTQELEALTRKPGSITVAIEGSRRMARGLQGVRGDDVSGTLVSGSAVTGVMAARAEELGRSIDLLRPLEDELLVTAPLADPVLEDATALSIEMAPELERLAAALPELNRTLALGDELRVQTDRLTGMILPLLKTAAPIIASLAPTVATIDPLLKPLHELTDTLEPYDEDITLASEGLIAATTRTYAEGKTAPNASALRFSPVLTCHKGREAYPEPGTTRDHSHKGGC